MLSFKQYINEKWSVDSFDSKRTGKKLFSSNWKKIDDHEVGTHFSGNADKEFNLEYTVNGNLVNQGTPRDTGKKIINHVNKSVNTFVRHMKPKELGFQSKYDQNISANAILAKRLARKHNGEVSSHETPGGSIRHVVRFKE